MASDSSVVVPFQRPNRSRAVAPSSPAIADLAVSFSRDLRAAKRSPRTIVLYNQAIRFYCDWLTANGRPTTLDQLTRDSVRDWLDHLSQRLADGTLRTRARSMIRFCRWLAAEGELDKPPTEGLEVPALPEGPVRIFTDAEVTAMLKACAVPRARAGRFDWTVFNGRRDEVILRLLLDCGLRVSELTGLELTNVDMESDAVYVMGKGARPRVVPFGARTGQAIDRYLRVRNLHPRPGPRLLLGERGALTPDGVRWRMDLISEASGVADVHPHAFRHTFAHRWLVAGGQERDLMRLAGWRSEAMLGVYARSMADSRAAAAHRRLALGDQV